MIITYHGIEFFKLSFGDITVACNPISKDSKEKTTKFGSDIALVSVIHPDMNGVEQLSHGDREPFVVRGPGEYEVRGVMVKGFPSLSSYGGEKKINTVYFFELEGMKVCYLGALGEHALSSEIREHADDIDILFLPIGGEGVLAPAQAHELAIELEPRIIIPMHYGSVGIKNALPLFLKEGGRDAVPPLDKLTIKRKELDTKEGEVVVLSV